MIAQDQINSVSPEVFNIGRVRDDLHIFFNQGSAGCCGFPFTSTMQTLHAPEWLVIG